MEQDERVEVSVSHTTRPQRPGEAEGVNYFFISTEVFHEMREAGAFFESAEVFGHLYGTSLAQLESRLSDGADVILEIDWQGAQQVKKAVIQTARASFILVTPLLMPPPKAKTCMRRGVQGLKARTSIEYSEMALARAVYDA
jgi:guanylate kinase (EC 2.7.4.8)